MTKLKNLLHSKKLALGSWITLAHPGIAEIMAKSGFSWLAIDLEHSSITSREAEDLIRVIELCGASPLVRVTSNNPDQIKRIMDCGAHGIIVPMVNSKEDALRAVSSVYYPPKGRRGVGLARAQGYGTSFHEYKSHLDKGMPTIIAQIENKDGVKNFSEIMSVDGIDGYMVGPYDLSASLGFPGLFDNPTVVKFMDDLKKLMAKEAKPGGYHIVEPSLDELKLRVNEGCKFLAYSLDTRIIETQCRAALKSITALT